MAPGSPGRLWPSPPSNRPGASPARPAALSFETTAEVAPLHGTIGQDRALDAIDFGLDVATPGYNLFLAGAAGSGRENTILDRVERAAARRPAPDDLVYAHNFAESGRPRALRLPAGRGCDLRRDLDELLAGAREEIPRAFEGEEFEARRQQALAEVQRRQEQISAGDPARGAPARHSCVASRPVARLRGLAGRRADRRGGSAPLLGPGSPSSLAHTHITAAGDRGSSGGARCDRGRGIRTSAACAPCAGGR